MAEWDDYETGPFCRHFYDPADCDRACARCAHRCVLHYFGDGAEGCSECECPAWVEKDDA